MRVLSWSRLAGLSMPLEVRRHVGRRDKTVPSGLAHHGVGGEALSHRLAHLLGEPRIERARSLTLVPFSLEPLAVDDKHLWAAAAALEAAWPGAREGSYRGEVVEARRAVARGGATEREHRLWLEHFLIENLVPAARQLQLPVQITWPGRAAKQASAGPGLEALLDASLGSWTEP